MRTRTDPFSRRRGAPRAPRTPGPRLLDHPWRRNSARRIAPRGAEALRRELPEEVGPSDLSIGPHIWIREGTYDWAGETRTEREYFYLVRADRFVADSSGNPDPGEREIMVEMKWWPVSDLPPHSKKFAPARLGSLVEELLEKGAPPQPIRTGF